MSLRRLALAVSLLVLGACTVDPPREPPAELLPHADTVALNKLWSSRVGKSGRGLFEPYISETRAVVVNRRGQVSSFDRRSGELQWQTDLDLTATSGIGGSTERIYIADSDATVHALRAEDGEPLWTHTVSSEILRPIVEAFDTAIVRSADGRVVALEPTDGTQRWIVSNAPPALSLNGYSRPLIVDGGVLLGLDDGRVQALDLRSGKLIWESVLSVPSGRSEVERLSDIDADLTVDNQGIYAASYQGRIARLEPGRGQIVWSTPVSAGSGLAVDDTGVVIIDEFDVVQRLDKETGQPLWVNESLRGRRLAPPAITPAGDVLLGDLEGYLHVLSVADGSSIGRARVDSKPITARPLVIADDSLAYVLSNGGTLAAYRLTQ